MNSFQRLSSMIDFQSGKILPFICGVPLTWNFGLLFWKRPMLRPRAVMNYSIGKTQIISSGASEVAKQHEWGFFYIKSFAPFFRKNLKKLLHKSNNGTFGTFGLCLKIFSNWSSVHFQLASDWWMHWTNGRSPRESSQLARSSSKWGQGKGRRPTLFRPCQSQSTRQHYSSPGSSSSCQGRSA